MTNIFTRTGWLFLISILYKSIALSLRVFLLKIISQLRKASPSTWAPNRGNRSLLKPPMSPMLQNKVRAWCLLQLTVLQTISQDHSLKASPATAPKSPFDVISTSDSDQKDMNFYVISTLLDCHMYLGQENLISDLSLGLLVLLQPSYSKVLTCTKIYTFHIINCCALESQTVFFKFGSNPMPTNLVAGLWYPRGCSD